MKDSITKTYLLKTVISLFLLLIILDITLILYAFDYAIIYMKPSFYIALVASHGILFHFLTLPLSR
ncbi:conserved hypothetical protein [Paenibacillus curdlanolyticus YK9]|uniref:Uncharacterized protein n=1 Tax=Paenibacillus curdlanolyticus YK9 TaxID=717606 RepID=E0IFZ9_9BACL|nr:conserved hypothetical protein [Paenibacillus curdlanolyticus YK9]